MQPAVPVRWCTTHNNTEVYKGAEFCRVADYRHSENPHVEPGCVILDAQVLLPENADEVSVEYKRVYTTKGSATEVMEVLRGLGHKIIRARDFKDNDLNGLEFNRVELEVKTYNTA